MKLKNKLIPLTTIASVAAVVAPIALTSCSYTLEGKVFDCTKPYSPTIKQAEEDVMDTFKLNDTYTKAVLDNKQILIEDLMWSASTFGNTFDPYFFISPILNSDPMYYRNEYRTIVAYPSGLKYSKDMKKVDNIGVSSKLITFKDGGQFNVLLLSFDIQYSIELSTYSLGVLDQLLGTTFVRQHFSGSLEGVLHFDTVPCFIGSTPLIDILREEEKDYPHMGPLLEWMISEDYFVEECGKWSIDLNQTLIFSNADKVEYCPQTYTISSNYKVNKETCEMGSNEAQLITLLNYSMFASYYLGKIIPIQSF